MASSRHHHRQTEHHRYSAVLDTAAPTMYALRLRSLLHDRPRSTGLRPAWHPTNLPHVRRFSTVHVPGTNDPLLVDYRVVRGRGAGITPVAGELAAGAGGRGTQGIELVRRDIQPCSKASARNSHRNNWPETRSELRSRCAARAALDLSGAKRIQPYP